MSVLVNASPALEEGQPEKMAGTEKSAAAMAAASDLRVRFHEKGLTSVFEIVPKPQQVSKVSSL